MMEEVIARAQQGDRDAMGHLWRTYHHLLLRYFRGKGMAEPDDLAQTVWLEVATSLARFEGDETDFRRWLFTIATRRRIDDIRARKRRQEFELQQVAAGHPGAPDAGIEADRVMSVDRAIALVRTLPTDQAEAVLLRIIADLDVADVAAIMGRRTGTIRVLVHRGLKRLHEQTAVTQPGVRTMLST
jgi:RNA polymerase sigma-70 factor (ECF subfamily)